LFLIIDDVSEIYHNEWAVFPKAVSNGVCRNTCVIFFWSGTQGSF